MNLMKRGGRRWRRANPEKWRETKREMADRMRRMPTRGEQAVIRFLKSPLASQWPEPDFQVPLLGYIADFYFREAKVVLEVDGVSHRTPQAKRYDAKRTAVLEAAGIHVFRIDNKLALENAQFFLSDLEHYFMRRGHMIPDRVKHNIGLLPLTPEERDKYVKEFLRGKRGVDGIRIEAAKGTKKKWGNVAGTDGYVPHFRERRRSRKKPLLGDNEERTCIVCGESFKTRTGYDYCSSDCLVRAKEIKVRS